MHTIQIGSVLPTQLGDLSGYGDLVSGCGDLENQVHWFWHTRAMCQHCICRLWVMNREHLELAL